MSTALPWENRIVRRADVPPQELTPHPRSWRRHPAAQQEAMVGILDQIGWVQAVIVYERTGYMVDGGLRRDVAIRRKQDTVPVVYIDVSEDEELMILATFDPIAALATADDAVFESLRVDLVTDNAALQALLDRAGHDPLAELRRDERINEAPPVPRAAISQRGDVWICGDHRVMCGDSTNLDDLLRLFGEERAHWMWTDPPYGVEYEGGTADRLRIENDRAEALPSLLAAAFAAADQVLTPGAPIYVAHPAGPLALLFGSAFVQTGWHLHQSLVWLKDSLVLGHSDYQYRHEPVLYGWKEGKHPWYGARNQTSVLEFPRPKRSPDHPTQKPVELVEAHLRNSTTHGEVGFDPFSGSGTTLIAAHRLGRRCFAMELSPRYADVTVLRWQRITGQQAVHVADGRAFATELTDGW